MKRNALVVIVESKGAPIDPQAIILDNTEVSVLSDADYHIVWEIDVGFNVVQHPLDVKGTKKGFISAPDVTKGNIDDRLRFALNESDSLTIWKRVV